MRTIRTLGLASAIVTVFGVAASIGYATASGGGTAVKVEFKTGGAISTPSRSFRTVIRDIFSAGVGPMVVRLSVAGYEQDWDRRPAFVGHHYAAMRVRVLVDGVVLPPGETTLIDNRGVVSVQAPRPVAAGYEWAGSILTSGVKTVKVQVANLHAFDMANINHWTLAVQHN